ncbi:MAG: hypothetical protein AB7F75_03050 [Planctomycetota bacterium]
MNAYLLAPDNAPPAPPEPGSREEVFLRLQRDKPTPIDTQLTLEAIGSFAVVVMVVLLLLYFLKPWFLRKKKIKRPPLVFEKIVTDESNVRSAIRVDLCRPMKILHLKVLGKNCDFSGQAVSLDLSMGGLRMLSTVDLPPEADLNFCFQESEIAASPGLNAVVLQSVPWKAGADGSDVVEKVCQSWGAPIFLARLSFMNLSPEARLFLTRLITARERESLAAKKESEGGRFH